ncbi:hypothetical protein [Lacticaseibacillus sharpeae]|uniref:hypothetical protein n=1 Tax=Lacticaseibacillus sharpeae TaxID=1626 RepID=UPI0006D2B23B|nr:hypothetical protein [Lacticaseibacillus sharpeae]
MANRLLLSKMWTRGREILARGDVEIDYEHADKIAATFTARRRTPSSWPVKSRMTIALARTSLVMATVSTLPR